MIPISRGLGIQMAARLKVQTENYRSVASALDRQLSRSVADIGPAQLRLNDELRAIDELLYDLLLHQLLSVDVFAHAERVDQRQRRWYDETMRRLQKRGALAGTSAVATQHAANASAAWSRWEQRKPAWLNDPDLAGKVVLTETMLRALPDIVTGRQRATDVMFPGGSMELVEGMYRDTFPARLFNEVVADATLAFIEQRL